MRRGYKWEIHGLSIVLATLAVILLFSPPAAVPAWAETSFSGRSFGIEVDPPLLGPTIICDTGELPSTGGSLGDLVNNASLSLAGQGVVATRLNCLTAGAGTSANSSVEIEGLQCTLSQLITTTTLAASLVQAQTTADCAGARGGTTISDLTIGGVSITVTGEANQTVEIDGIATLVVNEQVMGEGEITVNALHLTLLDGVECILGSVHSDIAGCSPLPTEQSTWGKVKALYR